MQNDANVNVCKKATELKRISDLQMNPIDTIRLNKMGIPNEQLVWIGRKNYYRSPIIRRYSHRWKDRLSIALEKNGYIRKDITEDTFKAGELYHRIYDLSGKDTSRIVRDFNDIRGNKDYENCQYFSEKEYYYCL